MEGVTGMMTRLGHMPGCSRAGLYGPENLDFRLLKQLQLQRARYTPISNDVGAGLEPGYMCASAWRRCLCAHTALCSLQIFDLSINPSDTDTR